MNRGDLYWVNLDPTVGAEIKKKRPCLVIGATPVNNARRTIVVIPLSSSPNSYPPMTIPVRCMDRDVVAVSDQIRTVDKSRLFEKIGEIEEGDLKKIEDGLRQILCL